MEYFNSSSAPSSSTALNEPLPPDLRCFGLGPCLGVDIKLPAGLGVRVRAYQALVLLVPDDSLIRPYPYQGRVPGSGKPCKLLSPTSCPPGNKAR